MTHRVIVVGLGCAGSAACAELAQRGVEVIGLDQFEPGHTRGGSGHQSRAFRLAYYEHRNYVPLLQAAREQWLRLNSIWHTPIFHDTGGIYLSSKHGHLTPDSLAAASTFDIPHERLDAKEVTARWPVFEITDEMVGMYEPLAGFIVPEHAIEAHISLARSHGATLHTGHRVIEWNQTSYGVSVRTDKEVFEADHLVLCAGAWTGQFEQTQHLQIRPSRQVLAWFDTPSHAAVDAPDLPVWALELEDASLLYGFPRMPHLPGPKGLKAARHWAGPSIDPDDSQAKAPREGDAEDVRPHLARWLPSALGPVREVKTCLYANSPDGHFRIGPHPSHPNVTLIAGLSGHGFKFQPILGMIAADLSIDGTTTWDIDFLSPSTRPPS